VLVRPRRHSLRDPRRERRLLAIPARVFLGHALHIGRITILVAAGPFTGEIGICHRPVQSAHGVLDVVLNLTRALGHRFRDARRRVHQDVLKMCKYSGVEVFEVLTRFS